MIHTKTIYLNPQRLNHRFFLKKTLLTHRTRSFFSQKKDLILIFSTTLKVFLPKMKMVFLRIWISGD